MTLHSDDADHVYIKHLPCHTDWVKSGMLTASKKVIYEKAKVLGGGIVYSHFVTYGAFSDWRKRLVNLATQSGVALSIETGAEYLHIRYSPTSELCIQSYFSEQFGMNPHELIDIIEQTPRAALRQAKLEAAIREHAAKVIPLPWDNQEYLGKRYLMKQAVMPTEQPAEGTHAPWI